MSQNLSPNQALDAVKQSDSKKVKVAITDLDGILRGKYIHKEKFLKSVEGGFGFCNVVFGWDSQDVCYPNVDFTGWHTGYPDGKVELDLTTYRKVPWDSNVPFFLGDFISNEGSPLALCPRQILKSVVQKAHKAGYEPITGVEYEWFNFKESPESLAEKNFHNPAPLTPGMFGYSLLRSGLNREFFNALMDELNEFDVPLEGLHTETGPGVYEAAIMAGPALKAADRGVLFKLGVKEIAYRFGIIPTFMARWNNTLPGCSGHLHQSLCRREDGQNLFYNPSDEKGLSPLFENYLAGQMKCLPELLPLFAPTVNSYKRLVEGFWAPTRVTWGKDNRTAAFRVILSGKNSTRLETRVSGSDINAYLALAAAIGSGLYGIDHKVPLTQAAISGNAYQASDAVRLPNSLIEATEKFHQSQVAREIFGNDFVEHYSKTREWEWQQYQKAVTDWELKRYFEII